MSVHSTHRNEKERVKSKLDSKRYNVINREQFISTTTRRTHSLTTDDERTTALEEMMTTKTTESNQRRSKRKVFGHHQHPLLH